MNARLTLKPPVVYPDCDGMPMSDNTKQVRWMTVVYGNLGALFRSLPDVFVAMDLLWYPVEGEPAIRSAPDVMVAFGRPKGDRGSYKQWEEKDLPVTVAFEVLSPSNDHMEMADKLMFYDQYGVEEYFVYDPETNKLLAYRRGREALVRQVPINGYVSPRLGIRFDCSGDELVIYRPDGRRFLSFEELEEEREKAEQRADKAEQRLTRLSELMRKALDQQASPAELQELQLLLTHPA